MSFPSEKLSSLRQQIHVRINELGVQDKIKECIEAGTSNGELGGTDEEHLLSKLREKGVIDQIMASLNLNSDTMDKTSRESPPDECTCELQPEVGLKQNKRYLFLRVLGGKAFLEHLQESDMAPEQVRSMFTLHVHFRQQRFKSRPVPCSCEPDIEEGFLLELSKHSSTHPDYDTDRMVSPNDALSITDSIHLVLTKTNRSGEIDLVGSSYLEWRHILSDPMGKSSRSLELSGVGSEAAKIPAGVLDISLELVPKLTQPISGDVVSGQLSVERSRCAERERLFLVYAKQWWKEYLQIRQLHAQRLVKVFAQDENATNRLVCMYMRPLRAGRLLDSPRQAARFVSLIGYERVASIGSSGQCRPEQWSSLHSFLCRRCGDCEDHALLLCSLLLGFGLNAYICIGCKTGGVAHTWVMTIAPDDSVTFWESLTAERFSHKPVDPDHPAGVPVPQLEHPYRSIGCVFNHQSFYANCQASDSLLVCQMDLTNQSLWKPMSEEAIRSISRSSGPPTTATWCSVPPLCAGTIDTVLCSNEVEIELRSMTSQYRMDNGLSTHWDDDLCYLLTSALAAYELDRCVGITSAGNEEFQQAIRWAVPHGHTFKGFPIQFIHRNVHKMFTTCLKSPVCADIIGCRGDHVRHAVRVKVYPYPEDVCAVWVMFAVKYHSVV